MFPEGKFERPEASNCPVEPVRKTHVPNVSVGTAVAMYAHRMTDTVDMKYAENSAEIRKEIGKMDNPAFSGSDVNKRNPLMMELGETVNIADLSGEVTHRGLAA